MDDKHISDDEARALLAAYRDDARQLLADHQIATVESLDQAATLLENALALPDVLHVGFVGESQVGKSSLINALLKRPALPAGGIGPLTAQATRVDYADENRLEVTYHGRQELNRLRFGIESYLSRRREIETKSDISNSDDSDAEGLEDVRIELDQELLSDPPGSDDDGTKDADRAPPSMHHSKKGEHMLNQARLMLTGKEGDQDSRLDRPVILDAIRLALGQEPLGDASRLEPLRERVAEVTKHMGTAERLSQTSLETKKNFNRALRLRAADWMSPLVKSLSLHLDVPLLRKVKLVDLPGIGVTGDAAAQEAERFVRQEGDALVLVMRNNGLVDELSRLLERSGVVTKLLFGGRDGSPAIRVLVAVTHLDNVAYERHRELAREAMDDGEPAPSKQEVFQTAAVEMVAKIRSQVREHLLASEEFAGLDSEQREHREGIVERLCAAMDVVCVSAPDYLDLHHNLTPRFLDTVEATGVPAVEGALERIGNELTQIRQSRVLEAYAELRESLVEHLSLVTNLYEEGGGRATAEWESFREELGKALGELRPQMAAHHGETLSFLNSSLPDRIENLCLKAENATLRRLDRVRKKASLLYWPSLNAALARKGRWEHKSLDYPGELTRSMVDAIAGEWEPMIVEGVRSAVRQMADRDIKLVERLCDVASDHDERIVADAHISVQKKLLQQQSRNCVRWTRDRLDDLSADVQEHLGEVVLEPISRACKRAIDCKHNRGTGATRRIVEAFHEGGKDAIVKAREASQKLLRKHYDAVCRELQETYLAKNHDPLEAAFQALTNEELGRARRSDAARKRHVLAKIAAIHDLLGVAA